jgi:hypothetical protein
MNDKKLWKAFSEFIRLRDSNEHGIVYCITCGSPRNWKGVDAGHGIGRQHLSTKFHEQNNHGQCKPCNGFEAGQRDIYRIRVDQKYGPGTWDKLILISRQTCKRSQFEIDVMEKYYKQEVVKLKKLKGIE